MTQTLTATLSATATATATIRSTRVLALGLLVLLALASPASAHVAPDPETNNRYVKVTLFGGEVRVVYVVYFGERPGAALRRTIDSDGNGVLDADEARRFGAGMLAKVAPAVNLIVDGIRVPASAWRVADVGLGTPTVAAGALSVDLSTNVAYSNPTRAAHTVWIEDGVQLDTPGEAQLSVEESPGVRVVAGHQGATGSQVTTGIETDFTFAGNPKADERAVWIELEVDPAARPRPDAQPRWPMVLAILGGLAIVAGGVGFIARRS